MSPTVLLLDLQQQKCAKTSPTVHPLDPQGHWRDAKEAFGLVGFDKTKGGPGGGPPLMECLVFEDSRSYRFEKQIL